MTPLHIACKKENELLAISLLTLKNCVPNKTDEVIHHGLRLLTNTSYVLADTGSMSVGTHISTVIRLPLALPLASISKNNNNIPILYFPSG